MRRPLVSMALALTMGIIAGGAWNLPAVAVIISAGILIAISLTLLIADRRRTAFIAACLAFSMAGFGYVRMLACVRDAASLSHLTEGPVILAVRGRVTERPVISLQPPRRNGGPMEHRTQFPLAVTEILVENRWARASGRLQFLVDGRADGITWNDRIEAVASAWKPSPPKNPGEYDYRAHLTQEGIAGVASASSPEALHIIGRAPAIVRTFESYRGSIVRKLEDELPEAPARILQCLLLGERAALDDAERRAFTESGTLHFLAISGLHVALVAGFVWYALLFWRPRLRLAAAGVLAAVIAYSALAGLQPSVVRSGVMCALICCGYLLRRKPDIPSSLALAWIIVLLVDPADLYRAGFQLSFGAVWAMWLFAKPLERSIFRVPDELDKLQSPEERSWREFPVRWAAQKLFCISIVASLVTFPILAYHFGSITPLAPLGSMLLSPIVWATIVIGLPGALLLPLVPILARLFLWPAAIGGWCMEWISALLARVPGSTLYLPAPGPAVLAICGLAAIVIALRGRLRIQHAGVAMIVALPAVAYVSFCWPPSPPEHLTVHMLAVGRGNCILLRFPDGRNILFDAGSTNAKVGERTIVPALQALGVRRLDAVVLSHGDSDHVSGFPELARRMPVGRVIVSTHFAMSPDAGRFYSQFLKDRDPDIAMAGDRIEGFDADIEVLWPPAKIPALKLSENELSLVLRVRSDDGSLLLTGDFGRGAADLLIGQGGDLRADILQAPHHGLPDPSAARIAEAVGAKTVLVSGEVSGAAPYIASGAKVLATDECGMISIEVKSKPRGETFLMKP